MSDSSVLTDPARRPIKFNHLDERHCPPDDLFAFSVTDGINMIVKPGSKILNLVPYAVEKFKNKGTNQLIWWSKHGAVSKTVTCAEIFKQKWSEEAFQESANDGGLYQQNQIYYQRCKCSVQDTQFECVIEEPAIAILFSKTPIPGQCEFANMVSSNIMDTVPPTRRRLDHLKKRKREVIQTSEYSKHKKQTSNSKPVESTETTDPLIHQSPRLAPASTKVSHLLPKLKSHKKRRLDNH